MPTIITRAPQLTGLSEAEIMAALNNPDPGNPIWLVRARSQASTHFIGGPEPRRR